MSEHFITDIEIKNFKCFEAFKAEGFKRVNLIGGKNNAGKTTLLEALYINANGENENEFLNAVFKTLRGRDNFFEDNNIFNGSAANFYRALLTIRAKAAKNQKKDKINSITSNNTKKTTFSFSEEFTGLKITYILNGESKDKNLSFSTLPDFFKSEKNLLKTSDNIIFLRPIGLTNYHINEFYGKVIELRETKKLNDALKNFDSDFEEFQIINKEPKVFDTSLNNFVSVTQLGDGAKKLINIFVALYSAKDGILLLDEIENGIHYKNLDKLWEIILTISKKQNVQIFATTHSKECIESFNREQLKLEDKNSSYFEMAKDVKTNEIFISAVDSEQLEYGLRNNERLRGE